MWETLCDAIKQIRKFTDKGSININTNGSMPEAVKAMCEAGLNSIRVSTNSVQEWLYNAYYLPNNYKFDALAESVKIVNSYGGWTSINYFVIAGVTDSEEEYQALRHFIKETGLKMIQWRNFNIDPDWYFEKVGIEDTPETMGIKVLMQKLKAEFPQLKYGYFNPAIERIKGDYEEDFAH
jgi:wyosine [tRNA(Phe)-imidazoG37] synthetase (radical SAM superfamily)